jgi:hypothetical protein
VRQLVQHLAALAEMLLQCADCLTALGQFAFPPGNLVPEAANSVLKKYY